MTITEMTLTILIVMIGTMFTRCISFVIFPSNKEPPEYIKYLGEVLPPAIMGLLIIYCMRNVLYEEFSVISEVIAIIFIIIIHNWKRNVFFSITTGTGLYFFISNYFLG